MSGEIEKKIGDKRVKKEKVAVGKLVITFMFVGCFVFFDILPSFSYGRDGNSRYSKSPYEFNLGYLFAIVSPEEIRIGDANFSIQRGVLHGLLIGLRYRIWDIFEVSNFKFSFGGTSRFGGAVGRNRISFLLIDISTFYVSVERNLSVKLPVSVEFALGTGSFGGTGLFVSNPSMFKISLIPLPLYSHLGVNTEIANVSIGVFASANFLDVFSLTNYMTEQGAIWGGGTSYSLMRFIFGISLGFGRKDKNKNKESISKTDISKVKISCEEFCKSREDSKNKKAERKK